MTFASHAMSNTGPKAEFPEMRLQGKLWEIGYLMYRAVKDRAEISNSILYSHVPKFPATFFQMQFRIFHFWPKI